MGCALNSYGCKESFLGIVACIDNSRWLSNELIEVDHVRRSGLKISEQQIRHYVEEKICPVI